MPEFLSRNGPGVGEGGIDPEETPSLATNGVLGVRVADGFVLDAGSWELAESRDRQSVTRIAPPVTPMFQQVVEISAGVAWWLTLRHLGCCS